MWESWRGFEPERWWSQEITCCSVCKLRFIRNWAYLGGSPRLMPWLVETPPLFWWVSPCCCQAEVWLRLAAGDWSTFRPLEPYTYSLPVWYRNLRLRNWPSLGPGVTGGRDSGGSDEAGVDLQLIRWPRCKTALLNDLYHAPADFLSLISSWLPDCLSDSLGRYGCTRCLCDPQGDVTSSSSPTVACDPWKLQHIEVRGTRRSRTIWKS